MRNTESAGAKGSSARDGFVLPVVIFTLTIMSVLAITALRTSSDEFRASRGLLESGIALYAAESGLDVVWPTCNYGLVGSLNPGDERPARTVDHLEWI